ncbi:hypothetical protein Vafri_14218 [Volvox africanus]|uniref:Guanylate cyclase domain-containing protein n=1 Tax=Volvox africanus TaxID=51714 RepID=A0A8J4BDL5_9CHLO|nr:hypothetical protein Vafri_14218 [Volvox africanus]
MGGGGCAVCPSPVGTPRDSRSRTHSGDCSSGGGGVIRRVLRWCGGSTGSGAATWSILGVSPSGAAGGTTLNEKSGNDRKGDGAGDEVGDDIFSTVGDRGGGGGGGNIATTAGSCSGGGGIRSFFCRSSGPGTEVDTAGFLSSSIMFSLERVASGGAGGGCPSATATVNVGYTVPPPGAAATLAASPDPRDIPDNVAAASDRASHPAVLLKMKERMSRRWRGTAPAAVDEACSGTERSPVSPNAVHQDAESIEQTRLPAGDNHELDLSVRKISPVKEVPTSIALPMSAAAAAAAVAANAAGQGGVHHDQHHDGGKNYPPVKVTSIANGAAVASFPQSRRNEISPLTVTYPGVPSRINEPWATYRCSSLSSGRRGAVQSSYTVKPPTAHYRIQAWQSQDPDSGRSLLMMTMHDVTTAVQVRNRAVRLLLQEHRILESLFPRHVLTFLVLNPEALGTQNRPDEDLLLDGVAARRCSNSGPDTTSVKCANASETTAPLVAGELESLQQQSRRKTAEVDSGSETPAVVIEQSQPMHTVRRMLAARQLATARVSQLATIHKMVTILIMDCVGFTSMCRQVEPRQVMHFLNELYSRFDALLDIYKVVKVETIGDAYVVAGGLVRYDTDGFRCVLPEGEVDHLHAVRVVEFARAMLRAARGLTLPHTGEAVMLRLGVHSGALMSGVVGTKQPRFTVFGETVELAKRVESAGVPGRIHVSTTTHALLTATAQTVATAATKRPKWESRLHGGGSSYGSGVSGGYRWEVTAPTAGSSCSSSTVHGSASSSGSVIPGQSHQGGTTEGLSMPAPGAASYTTKAPTTAPGGYLLIDEAGDSAEALQRVAAVYL